MNPSLLIVDDEANFLLLLDRTLSREGYQITIATSAPAAFESIDQQIFDFAIVDLKMYPYSGIEVLEAVKRRSPATQVIIVTAYPAHETRDQCVKLGAAEYMIKPIEIPELKTALHRLGGPPA